MARVEITSDLFAHHNPLKFKQHPKGSRLYWANRAWRRDRKGWGQLKPVRTTDAEWPEIRECLAEAPLDMDLEGDNLVRRGDLVLCVKSQEEYERTNLRREYLANRKIAALEQGHNPVTEELSRLGVDSEHFAEEKPKFQHGRSHGQSPVMKTGGPQKVR